MNRALKGLSSKAEEMLEKTKTSVGEMAAEKKAAAAALLEAQAKKTGDVLWQGKGNAENIDGIVEGKQVAIDGFDKEIEKVVDDGVQEVSTTIDSKMKEADSFIDEKREEVVKTVQDEATKATSSATEGFGAVLGKAKGLLNF